MSTTAMTTGNEIATLRHQAGLIHKVVHINVAGVTQEESLINPEPEGNCLNWVVGHLVCIYNNVMPLIGQRALPEADRLKRYDRGSAPVRNASEAMELSDLLSIWDEASNRVDAGLANLTQQALDARAPFSPTNDPKETVRSLISTVLFHQAYHSGQLGVLRRIAGKPGAIA
jgi:DinB family protein